jgi:hypothetical protein
MLSTRFSPWSSSHFFPVLCSLGSWVARTLYLAAFPLFAIQFCPLDVLLYLSPRRLEDNPGFVKMADQVGTFEQFIKFGTDACE